MHLIAVDPGIDEVVLSIFGVGRFREQLRTERDRWKAAGASWIRQERIQTGAKLSDAERLGIITRAVRSTLAAYQPAELVCEHPSTWITFGKNPSAHVAILAYSVGIIETVAELTCASWRSMEPDSAPRGWPAAPGKKKPDVKAYRRAMVERFMPDVARQLTTGDQRDAAWLGIRALVGSSHQAPKAIA
jgi:Holliday junction resolvasome RuvABC endonuclease subunit